MGVGAVWIQLDCFLKLFYFLFKFYCFFIIFIYIIIRTLSTSKFFSKMRHSRAHITNVTWSKSGKLDGLHRSGQVVVKVISKLQIALLLFTAPPAADGRQGLQRSIEKEREGWLPLLLCIPIVNQHIFITIRSNNLIIRSEGCEDHRERKHGKDCRFSASRLIQLSSSWQSSGGKVKGWRTEDVWSAFLAQF